MTKFKKLSRYILVEIRDWIEFFINNIPGNFGFFLRKYYYKKLFKGNLLNCRIQRGFIAECSKNIFLGDNITGKSDFHSRPEPTKCL